MNVSLKHAGPANQLVIKNNSNKVNNTLFGNIKLLKNVFLQLEKMKVAP